MVKDHDDRSFIVALEDLGIKGPKDKTKSMGGQGIINYN
jgi:hypothetical protein